MKKKLLSRVLALGLAATMAVGMSVTAFAAEGDAIFGDGAGIGASNNDSPSTAYPEGMVGIGGGSMSVDQLVDRDLWSKDANNDDTDRGQIAVSGITDDVKVMAYRFIEAQYGADGKFSGYKDVAGSPVQFISNGSLDTAKVTRDNIAKLAYAEHNGWESYELAKNGDSIYKYDEAKPGSYVIVVESKEGADNTHTYGAMIVSVAYAEVEGSTGLAGYTLKLVANMAMAKMQDEPTIEKAITGVGDFNSSGENAKDIKHGGMSAAVDANNQVWFDIIVANIPEYHGTYPVFEVVDTMDTRLVFDESSVQYAVFFGDKPTYSTAAVAGYNQFGILDDYKITLNPKISYDASTGRIVFDFCSSSSETGYQLNDYAGRDLVIRYKADVKDGADLGFGDSSFIDMKNSAKVVFSHDSNVNGDEGETDPTPDVHVYTFRIDLDKLDANDKTLAIEGAEFGVYLNEVCTAAYLDADSEPVVLVSNADGSMDLVGVGVGTYYIKETKAPKDYALNDSVYAITVLPKAGDADYASVAGSSIDEADKAAQITAVKINVKPAAGDATGEMEPEYAIYNTKMTELPSTGGAGTALLVALGIIGAIAGSAVMFATRKKEE